MQTLSSINSFNQIGAEQSKLFAVNNPYAHDMGATTWAWETKPKWLTHAHGGFNIALFATMVLITEADIFVPWLL